MTVFTESQPTTSDNQNSQQDTGNNQSFVELIVKEKGEQWKDPEALAKGYLHAQERIKELQEQASKVDVEDFSRQLLEQLKAQTAHPSTPPPSTPDGSEEENTTLKPEDIQSLIDAKLTSREKEAKAQENVRQVQQALTAAFGTEAKATVEAKAKEAGLSMERMDEIAKESPAAYMAIVGSSLPKQTNTLPTNEVVNTSPSNTRNNAYYQNLRRTNRKQFMLPETQNQMVQDRLKLGEAFYN